MKNTRPRGCVCLFVCTLWEMRSATLCWRLFEAKGTSHRSIELLTTTLIWQTPAEGNVHLRWQEHMLEGADVCPLKGSDWEGAVFVSWGVTFSLALCIIYIHPIDCPGTCSCFDLERSHRATNGHNMKFEKIDLLLFLLYLIYLLLTCVISYKPLWNMSYGLFCNHTTK